MPTAGWGLKSPGTHHRFREWPQNKAATEARLLVIELRIFLKLEGEAD